MYHLEKIVANIYIIRNCYWTLVNLFISCIRFSVTDLLRENLVTDFVFDYKKLNHWIVCLVKKNYGFSHYFSFLVIFYAYNIIYIFLSTTSISFP
jgi:hypothetical protein